MADALKLYLSEMKTTINYFKYFGFDFFREDFKINFIYFVLVLDLTVYILVQIYSFNYFRDNFLDLFFCLATVGYCIQFICVILTFYSNRKLF